jgi:phage tail sheath protein FI
MPVAVSYPGVYVQEAPSGVRTITGVATSIALFIGWAPKGPTDRAVRITSYADFERTFGGLDRDSYLGYAVRAFYLNGGADAFIIRIADSDAVRAWADISGLDGLRVQASSPGDWANGLHVDKIDTPNGIRLDVLDAKGTLLETFIGLSATKGSSRYLTSVINGKSLYIELVEPPAPPAATPPASTPATPPASTPATPPASTPATPPASTPATPPTSPPATPAVRGMALDHGNPGTVLHAEDPHFKTQLSALFAIHGAADQIDLFNIICVPGLTDKAALEELQTAAKNRRAFLIADCPLDATVATADGALPKSSERDYSAFYFPWVMAADPEQSYAILPFPPSGFIAGIYARTDSARGVWKAPAGTDAAINGATGLKVDMSDRENGLLNPKGINCLRTFSVYGNVVWGARTSHGDDSDPTDYKYIPVRRLALFIEESLYRGTQWVVFEPNDEPLWAQIRLNVGAFMNTLFRQGAFQGTSPKDAYFVKCDKETTPQDQINLGIVNVVVGFAPLKPAEFVILTIQQMAGQLQV